MTRLSEMVPLVIVTALYVVQSLIFVYSQKWPQALIFGGYALANIGAFWVL